MPSHSHPPPESCPLLDRMLRDMYNSLPNHRTRRLHFTVVSQGEPSRQPLSLTLPPKVLRLIGAPQRALTSDKRRASR